MQTLIIEAIRIFEWSIIIFAINIALAMVYAILISPLDVEFEEDNAIYKYAAVSLMPVINLFILVYMSYTVISTIIKKIRD